LFKVMTVNVSSISFYIEKEVEEEFNEVLSLS